MSEEDIQLRKIRGQRVRMIREKFLGLSRGAIQRKYRLSISTLQSWEDPLSKNAGLVENGAKKLLKIFKAEGLDVNLEWLMYGIGDAPLNNIVFPALKMSTNKFSKTSKKEETKIVDNSIIIQELKLFNQLNKDPVHAVVQDDALSPWLAPGDYVAGTWYFEQEIEQALGIPAIVQTVSGETLIRVVKLHTDEHASSYSLVCTNPKTTVAEPEMKKVKLFGVAPILWIRKPKVEGDFLF